MADEIDARISMTIQKRFIRFQSVPTQFFADMEGDGQPLPGLLEVTIAGVEADIGTVNTRVPGGVCLIENHGPGEYVEFGIRDPEMGIFYPLAEILPGERFIVRLARTMKTQYGPTGTGTTGHAYENQFWFQSHGDTSVVLCYAFEG